MWMDIEQLARTAKSLVAEGKGVLAADESSGSCQKRFDAVGIECTAESRRQYRQILCDTEGTAEILSGIIFYDETFWQANDQGVLLRESIASRGILPGIKVDLGLLDLPGFPNEKVSKGLDDLSDRMANYATHGARFAKWRSVITIGEGIPTDECIGANTYVLARYARICQDAGVVPMVEPEILFDGTHTIEQAEEVLGRTLDILFQTMRAFRVYLPGAILKTSMVLPGKDSGTAISHDDVAERTVRILHNHVPAELGGVVFLSGGQTSFDAFMNLSKIKSRGPHPWGLTFSYSRAIQDPVLKYWALHQDDIHGSGGVLMEQLRHVADATRGVYSVGAMHDTFVSGSQDL